MPVILRGQPEQIRVAPSAFFELTWALFHAEWHHAIEGPHASLEPLRLRFGPELSRLKAAGVPPQTVELVVLAYRRGLLLEPDLADFFPKITEAATESAPLPSLSVESPEVVEGTSKQLELLRTDSDARLRYARVLEEIWSVTRPEWEEQGRPAVMAAAKRWTEALAKRESFRQVLEIRELLPGRPDVDAVADKAEAEGRLVLTPCWFGGPVNIYELDGAVYVGRGLRMSQPPTERELAAAISSSVRALSEPTRVAILLRLAHHPSSVSDLARHFDLSQPAVSGHVQILREAGLLDERIVGRSAVLSANEERVMKLFSESASSLRRAFRAS